MRFHFQIYSHNSTKSDEIDRSKVRDFSKWITTLESVVETKKVTMPFLNSTFDTTVRMNLDDREIKKCFVNFCEDGSTIPKDLHEFFNCSDIGDVVCTLTALMGPRNDSCWIPGFSSCISKRKIKKTNATLQKN